ncbi:hypothetical protein [Acidicapsa acidisoli]|uniref:hypothetical protein n=1 Tax=Acidicapsa acidisoli TaxID=1615681 RepID=UPI0021E0B96D|nr:hypothetical protein [Acidicapsa acidisoli]
MIQDEITPHIRMMLSQSKRNLLAVISAAVFGPIVFISYSHAQTKSAVDVEVSDASAASVVQTGGVAGDSRRPFRINIPEEALIDLHRRLAATQWPEKEAITLPRGSNLNSSRRDPGGISITALSKVHRIRKNSSLEKLAP